MHEQTLTFSTNGLKFETPILEVFQNMWVFIASFISYFEMWPNFQEFQVNLNYELQIVVRMYK